MYEENSIMHAGTIPEFQAFLTEEQKRKVGVMRMDMKVQWLKTKIHNMEKLTPCRTLLESGNMLAKQIECLQNERLARVVLGAKVPIILTSRVDNPKSLVVSCAIATHGSTINNRPTQRTELEELNQIMEGVPLFTELASMSRSIRCFLAGYLAPNDV